MMGKNILAVYPYQRRSSETRFMPPMGLEYVMAAVEDLVDKITIIDMRLEDDYDLCKFIDSETETVCISMNWWPSELEGGVVREFDLINRIPRDVLTIVGGRWATLHVDRLFESCPNIDIIVKCDGDETIRELATSSSPAKIRGISYRANRTVYHNPLRRLARLSETVYPNRMLRRYKYSVAARGIDLGITIDSVLTSRGCPFRCKFCTYNYDSLGRRRPWQARSPESVVAELQKIDADVVFFADNNFCLDMDRVAAICDLVVRERIQKTFSVEARIEIARRPDVLAKMVQAGFRIIFFGLESAYDKTLRQLNKGFTVDQVRAAFNIFRRYNFVRCAFFIVGNIGETEREMFQISKFAKELGVDFISLSYLRAEQGSALVQIVKDTPGYHIAAGRKPKVYSDKYPPTKLRKIHHAISTDFYYSAHMLHSLHSLLSLRLFKLLHPWRVVRSLGLLLARIMLPRRLAVRLRPLGGER